VRTYLSNNPDATTTDVLQGLQGQLPSDFDTSRTLVEEVRAGVDRAEVVEFDEWVPEWRVESVTIDGEERAASAGNGVEMVALEGESGPWRPPHTGGRACSACGSEAVVSAYEARSVYRHDTDAEYWCSDCGTEFGAIGGSSKPPEAR
jgi:hypothetical protein